MSKREQVKEWTDSSGSPLAEQEHTVMSNNEVSRSLDDGAGFHIIAGSGGCRAMLATIGMLLALFWFGMRKIKSVGGISGGAIPMAFLAAGFHVKEIAKFAVELDFQSLLDYGERITWVLIEHYSGSRQKGDPPAKGTFNMNRFESWLHEKLGTEWPEHLNFWTMATDVRGAQVLLCGDGVFHREEGGTFVRLASGRPSLSKSICATCTVPAVFMPVDLPLDDGSFLKVWDGALSWESMRPVSLVEEFYNATPGEMILCDVGVELNRFDRYANHVWRLICGGRCVPPRRKRSINEDKMLVIEPAVMAVRSFEFAAHSDKKWLAIMEGFAATVDALNRGHRLTDVQYLEGRALLDEFKRLVHDNKDARTGKITEQTEQLLSLYGVL